jgi:hypothetical protein
MMWLNSKILFKEGSEYLFIKLNSIFFSEEKFEFSFGNNNEEDFKQRLDQTKEFKFNHILT